MDDQPIGVEAHVPADLAAAKERVRNQIRVGASLDGPYLIMNVLATVLACYGLLADNGTAVIGAMVVAQLLGPIMGIALSLVDGEQPLLRRGLVTLVVGIACVLATAYLIGLFHRGIPASEQLLSRTHPQFSDLVIALAGGAAAAYATVSPRVGTALVGVAVATAMVPPLCASAIFLGRGEFDEATQAFVLAFTNVVAIQFAASVVLWACGYHGLTRRWEAGYRTLLRNGVTVLMLASLGVLLAIHSYVIVVDAVFTAKTSGILREELQAYPGTYLAEVRHGREGGRIVVRAVVRGPEPLSPEQVAAIEDKLPAVAGVPVELHVRFVRVEILTRTGPQPSKGKP